ncbi:MAG: S9 family peptidase [Candidatus Kapabacteria bacterium]|nr:S9 family peptidase [Candidatus Kapabacteria bacterium]
MTRSWTNRLVSKQLLLIIPAFCFFVGVHTLSQAQSAYKMPPKAIADIIDAPVVPQAILSPRRDAMLLIETKPNPSLSVIAEPVLKLAGVRINPELNSSQRIAEVSGFTIQPVGEPSAKQAGAKTAIRIQVPAGSKLGSPSWSYNGSSIAFTRDAKDGVELWVADAATGAAKQVGTVRVSDILGAPYSWMADGKHVLAFTIPPGRAKAPEVPRVPAGPVIEESLGKMAQVMTFQDLLKNSGDESLFEYYATTQLAMVNVQTGAVTALGAPGIYAEADLSPNEEFLLVSRLQKPFSYRVRYDDFAKTHEVWDVKSSPAKLVKTIASLPIADQTPRMGVPMGVRGLTWQALHPAKLLWVEALDGGDPMKKVDFRDKIMTLSAPFIGEAQEVVKVKHRFAGYGWTATKDQILLTEYDRDRRWRTTYLMDMAKPQAAPKVLFDLSVNDSYNDPGQPMYERRTSGERVLLQDGDWIYLTGVGASEKGERPFLDKMNLQTKEKKRLYQCGETSFETVLGFNGAQNATSRNAIITRYESKTEYPNFVAVDISSNKRRQITSFQDPAPQLTALKKELVKYKRADGVPLSGTLYLPADYKAGTRLPLMIVAYPLEYNDAATAGQVRTSPNRFTVRSRSYSQVYLALQGYAVLDGATMPIVGSPETMNDTFIEQITAASKAAIDYLDSLGVIDRKRVGVSGHSYGAFMTANLLAHTDLFAAGVAGSGAYNRTLTPFGFQGERRNFWEAKDVYMKLSPFTFANKIKKPLLMTHGEADNNPGTFPIQSQRLYQAISGTGGTAKLVMLPYESHGYSARESVMHVMAEMVEWMDKYVKNAPKTSD